MSRRHIAWSVLSTCLLSGCLIDRGVIGGERADGGRARDAGALPDAALDAPGLDAFVPRDGGGRRCVPVDCADGDPCTDDICSDGECLHEDNTAICDDGVLCNGGDTCSRGSCTVHDGVDPCSSPTRCDAARDVCVGCDEEGDCPDPILGPPGDCVTDPGEVCAEDGERSRTVTSFQCEEGACVPQVTMTADRCTLDRSGEVCSPAEVTDWSDCLYDDACGTSGYRTRSVTTSACAGGTCASSTMVEADGTGCDRTTDMLPCGSETCDSPGPCVPTSMSCSTVGTQTRVCRTPSCGRGICGGIVLTRSDEMSCVADVTGVPCSPTPGCTMCRTSGSACPSGMMGTQLCSDADGASCSATGFCIDSTPVSTPCMCP